MKLNGSWFAALITAGALFMTAVPASAAEPEDIIPQNGDAVIASENPFAEDPDYTKLTPEDGTDMEWLLHGDSASGQLTTVTLQDISYSQSEARTMLDLVNNFRTSSDAWYWDETNTQKVNAASSALTYDYGLEEIAMQRAAEIATSYSPTRPDGTSCFTAAASDGSTSLAENIAAGSSSSADVIFNLLKEEDKDHSGQGHRRNMLGTGYTAMGAACVTVNGFRFWVQEFGTPTGVGSTSALDGTKNVTINISSSQIADVTDSNGNTAKAIDVYFNLPKEKKTYSVYTGQSRDLPTARTVLLLKNAYPDASVSPQSAPYIIFNSNITWSLADSTLASVSGGTISGTKGGQTKMRADVTVAGITYASDIDLIVASADPVPMYRMYNPNSGEHFYTKDASEKAILDRAGWRYEGIGWNAPAASDTPVYRLYNPNAGDHHYTISLDEADMLKKAGWIYEGVGWYSDYKETTPVYRQYNPNAVSGAHNYTTNKAENDQLVQVGWRGEGTGWYGL
ncbi:MAG: CAP domain-containing protein [Lachnospiraceae bacterium]|nr:CAP domain-containing protein [Lachnospiraceae bacterium]MCI1328252.1 CAP domain-containing protein [Lachnospiraceae bacterium]